MPNTLPCDGKVTVVDHSKDKDDDHQNVTLGVAFIFERCTGLRNTHGMLDDLDALCKNELMLEHASTLHFEVLQSTIDELLSADEEKTEESEKETLIDGNHVIGKILDCRSEVTITSVDAPEVSGPRR